MRLTMTIYHVHLPCHLLCPSTMPIYHAHLPYPSTMPIYHDIYHAHLPCPSTMPIYHAHLPCHLPCPSTMPIYHAHLPCPMGIVDGHCSSTMPIGVKEVIIHQKWEVGSLPPSSVHSIHLSNIHLSWSYHSPNITSRDKTSLNCSFNILISLQDY